MHTNINTARMSRASQINPHRQGNVIVYKIALQIATQLVIEYVYLAGRGKEAIAKELARKRHNNPHAPAAILSMHVHG